MHQPLDFTFLAEEQIFGNSQLEILQKYGTKCAITDFAILLGGDVTSDEFTSEGNTLNNRTGWWWTKSSLGDDARVVSKDGRRDWKYVDLRIGGARPALPYSSISAISSNGVRGSNGIKEIEYGEYPQTIVTETLSQELENLYNNNILKTTGKNYTTDSVKYDEHNEKFNARIHTEYEYNGSKYIRLVGDYNCDSETLSDGIMVKKGQPYWVKVEPITWLIDEKANIALAKKILFAGVQFKNTRDYDGDFSMTDIKQFMDRYFAKEITAREIYVKPKENGQTKDNSRKQNPYGFNFENVSEEDIIRGAVESKIAVFLHGRSSEGKSARVKQLDPDAEIIYMRNVTPDSLNGKSVYVPPITKRVEVPVKKTATIDGEEKEVTVTEYQDVIVKEGYMMDVKPSWLVNVEEKCKKEPNKLHIIFFDELTNALPSIQGMAFNIILDGEVNGKWKLPDNARIVAAGNDLDDSLAANKLAEPLFNRFAHVYINITVDSWLKWASTPTNQYKRLDYVQDEPKTKIHPAIYAYIAYKSFSNMDVLRTPYTGDKPNADPRKWEMASKILYKTNQPTMLRALIGDALTNDFVAFTSLRVITVEDVINNNYTDKDLEMDVSQKFATAVGLSSVDEEHFEVVRNFMKQLGAEVRAAFESMWACGDEARLEKIIELQLKDNGGIKR